MGRIKTAMVKRAAWELLEDENHKFTEDFSHDKKLLANTMPSKKVRNKIAGFLARIERAKKAQNNGK